MGSVDDEYVPAADDESSNASFVSASSMTRPPHVQTTAPLLRLPLEIIHHILSFMDCEQLILVARTCRQLKKSVDEDLLWLTLLREHIPRQDFPHDTPYPSPTYRHLYISHHPYWFLPRHKIWISDEPLVGKLTLCKFDPRRGCIEAYRLLAEGGPATIMRWEHMPSVLINNFNPRVHLWLDDPVLKLPHEITTAAHGKQGWWDGEIRMSVGRAGHNISASFFLARDIPEHYQAPSMDLWPPRTIPGMPRVRAASQNKFRGKEHKPQTCSEISQTTFRIRHWSQFFTGFTHVGVRLGEEVSTWSTLDPSLYVPTKEKPYQGIFVGDYAGHGCEFLLIIQTDAAPPPPRRTARQHIDARMQAILSTTYREALEAEQLLARKEASMPQRFVVPNLEDDIAHSGALEAIKLTGDPNVPRGEHTFIADDIGPRGLVRIAAEEPFRGARIVKCRGHIATQGFIDDEFIPTQLIMINPDRLAQYWLPLGHISYYQRVDIDALLANTNRTRRSSSDC